MGYVKEIVAGGSTHLVEPILYGTCAAAANENKTVALSNFELVTGVTIHVKFTNSNTKSDATLNVNSQGAKPIIRYNGVPVGTDEVNSWASGAVVSFTYDGTSWVINSAPFAQNFILPVSLGGTGANSWASGKILVGNGSNTFNTIDKATAATGGTLVERNADGDFSARNITMTQGNIGSMTLSGTTIAALTTINTSGGNGLLSYKPSSWTGVTSSQWAVGTVDIQGVIRSNNSDLLHSRAGTNSAILDEGNYKTCAYALDGSNTGAKLQISTQSAAYTNGIQFMNSTTKKGSIGTANNGTIGIYGTKIVLRPQLDSTTTGVEVTTDAMYPTASITLGTASNKWSTVYATIFDGDLDGNAATANILACSSITTEANIEIGTRSYRGSGTDWTGSINSMQYAGILQVCGDFLRGWQIWARRGDNSLHWRNPNDAATAWNTERIIIDSGNYTSYAVAATAGVTAVTWDATNKKLTRTINKTTADVVTIGTIKTALALTKSDVGLGNVANSTYAGGTAVTLNNSSKASSTASFYAPTTGGTADTQALVGNGTTAAPKWVDISPSITIGAGTGSAAPTVNVSVLGQSGVAKPITIASTSVYGVTKLNDGISSNSTSLAATANSALVAAKKVASSNSTSKLYLVGATSQSTTGVDSYSYQYTYTNNGLLSALKVGLNLNGAEKAHLEWNNTDQSIDFVFN